MIRRTERRLAVAALLASACFVSTVAADALDEEVARIAAEREFATQWTQSTADALRARGDVESRALALLLAPSVVETKLTDAARAEAAGDPDSAVDEAAIDEAALTLEAEVGFVLDSIEQLPVELRAGLVEKLVPAGDVASRRSVGERMATSEPTDPSGWLLRLDSLQRLEAEEGEIDALLTSMAANAPGGTPWFLGFARRLDAALASVPPPAPKAPITWGDALGLMADNDIEQAQLDQPMAIDDYRMLLVMGRSMAIAYPGYSALTKACEAAAADRSSRALACERIGRQLATRGATVLDVNLGLGLWHRQVEGSAAEAQVVAAKRDYHWQMEQGVQVVHELQGSPEGAQRYAAMIRASTSDEIDVLRDLMRERGIPLTPPREWMPANPVVLQARR